MPEEARLPVYTVGHSTRSIEDFAEILQSGRVQRVIDVRSTPRSRTNPQFNFATLPGALAQWQIGYELIEELGGRRNKQKSLEPAVNGWWTNQSFHNYADYALSAEFKAGLVRLLDRSNEQICAIMCSEAVWWRCHRRIIADYLLLKGRRVFHLMDKGKIEVAKPSLGSRIADGEVLYPDA